MSQQGKAVYSTNEKMLLLSLIEEHKDILETKRTDGTSLQKKNETWKEIQNMYNSNDVIPRTAKQLKKCWENVKHKTRKYDTEMKRQMFKTGGGPPVVEDKDPVNERVRTIVPTINFCLENTWDSSGLFERKEEGNVERTQGIENVQAHETQDEQNSCMSYELSGHVEEMLENDPPERHEIETPRQKSTPIKGRQKTQNTLSLIEEERKLRIQKLQEAIEQQRELHRVKMEAVRAETQYWITKLQHETMP